MASGTDGPDERKSFWTTVPGILTGLAALIGAVVSGLALFIDRDDNGEMTSTANRAEKRAYQTRVVALCDQDREQEIRLRTQFARLEREGEILGQQFNASRDPSVIQPWIKDLVRLIDDAVARQAALKGELEALNAPSDLAATHDEGVAVWGRLVSFYRSAADQLSTARTDFEATGDPTQFVQVADSLNDPQEEALGDQVDVHLRRLGGSGCNPAR